MLGTEGGPLVQEDATCLGTTKCAAATEACLPCSLCSAAREAPTTRGLHTTTREEPLPCSPQLGKAHAAAKTQQAKTNLKINKNT